MDPKYNFRDIESKYTSNDYKVSKQPKHKYYVLEMFPYPSGRIHIGHVRNYTIGDIYARYKISCGFDVLHPMGWDAFGLPAENAALEKGLHPRHWTLQNIEHMKSDLKRLNFAYNWNAELATCNPSYYKHTQALFIDLFERGLVYKKAAVVNWDPVENTVLANEQVIDGRGYRSKAVIEQREMDHWFIKITDYAQDLLDGLPDLDWPQHVKTMQKNWIGKSNGCVIKFKIYRDNDELIDTLEVFTTTPNMIFGCSFIALSAKHELLKHAKNDQKLHDFVQKYANKTSNNKHVPQFEGVQLHMYASHPYTGVKMPVYVTDYVLADYGTGCVFGCPGHDDRDKQFAENHNLEILNIVDEHGKMINSQWLDGLDRKQANAKAVERFEQDNTGYAFTSYKLKDWGISRKRYWGCPIPLIHCEKCGTIPLNKDQLPLNLPEDVDFSQHGNPLERHPTWKHTACHKCGGQAVRECETMDTFIDSSWYFLHFAQLAYETGDTGDVCCDEKTDPQDISCNKNTDIKNGCLDNKTDLASNNMASSEQAFTENTIKTWMPVDIYIGGVEHAILHLLYARFFMKAFTNRQAEPFKKLFAQGLVCSPTYQLADGKYVYPEEVEYANGEYKMKDSGAYVMIGGPVKMSKSLKNDINLRELLDAYGTDALRMTIVSDSPCDGIYIWEQSKLQGTYRFLNKLWNLGLKVVAHSGNKPKADMLDKKVEQGIKGVTKDIENLHYNTCVAKIRILFNAIEHNAEAFDVSTEFDVLLRLAFPIIPTITKALYDQVYSKDIMKQDWPVI